MRMLSATKRRTPLRAGVWPGDVWVLGSHRLTVGARPGDLDVAEAVLRAFGLYTGQHAQLVERNGVAADHGAAAQLTYEAGYERADVFFGLPVRPGIRHRTVALMLTVAAGQEAPDAETPQA